MDQQAGKGVLPDDLSSVLRKFMVEEEKRPTICPLPSTCAHTFTCTQTHTLTHMCTHTHSRVHWNVDWLELVQLLYMCHSCSEFTSTGVLSCPEVPVSPQASPTSGSYSLSVTSSKVVPEAWRESHDKGALSVLEPSNDICS